MPIGLVLVLFSSCPLTFPLSQPHTYILHSTRHKVLNRVWFDVHNQTSTNHISLRDWVSCESLFVSLWIWALLLSRLFVLLFYSSSFFLSHPKRIITIINPNPIRMPLIAVHITAIVYFYSPSVLINISQIITHTAKAISILSICQEDIIISCHSYLSQSKPGK